ncbi:YuzB family protein [Marinicrinis sediminis]|uniref:YuzB family protein n=1 Tax=Marinicrinis sediminis TaxID=1652465 RepID=A0ABW5R6J0_9BACL
MRPIIEFCASNMHHGTDRVMNELEQNPEFDVIEYGCLGNCGQCMTEPYALVNGTIVEAPSPEALLQKILDKIREEEENLKLLDDLDL